MFTYTKNDDPEIQTRVCRIEGGKNDDKIVYLNKNGCENPEIKYDDAFDLLHEDFFKEKNYKLMKRDDQEKIRTQLSTVYEDDYDDEFYDSQDDSYSTDDDYDQPARDPRIQKLVEQARKIIKDKCTTDIELHDGARMNICPSTTPERIYISGRNGSGKSRISGIYMQEYNKLFPRNKIIMFSVHEKDKAYDGVKRMLRIDLKDENLMEKVLEVPKFKNTLVVFDDCDSIQDKKLKSYIEKFELDLLTNGRKYGIYMLTLSHMLMNYKSTREKINECSRVIMFGRSGSRYHINRFLKIHGGLTSKQIKRIFALPSRWFCFSNDHPIYVLYESGVYLIKDDDNNDD